MTRKNKARRKGASGGSKHADFSAQFSEMLEQTLLNEGALGETNTSNLLDDLVWFIDHPTRDNRLRRIAPGETWAGQDYSHVVVHRTTPGQLSPLEWGLLGRSLGEALLDGLPDTEEFAQGLWEHTTKYGECRIPERSVPQ